MSVRSALPPRFSFCLTAVFAVALVVLLLLSPAWAGGRTKILYRFHPRQGTHPFGGLAVDGAGNVYGTTQDGGILTCGPFGRGGCGTVFELAPQPDGSWTHQILHQFLGGPDGAEPYTSVILDGAGNLYGTTAAGGNTQNGGFGYGTAYEVSPGAGGWSETVLHTFAVDSGDGEAPVAPLAFDGNGNLYGTTYQGLNPCGTGTVFQLSPNQQGEWTENQLYCFEGTGYNGSYPSAGVIFDNAGNLYSTTYLGGTEGNGTIFELSSSDNWKETILYDFPANAAGPAPYASLVADKSGNLYGVTYGGVFQLTPSGGGWSYSTIYSSAGGLHGISPYNLIIDEAGNLYGAANGGDSTNCGGGGCGAVFKLTHRQKGWHLTVLHNFQGGMSGATPFGGLVMDQQGNLYGTTYFGGRRACEDGCGLVFEITR